MTHPNVVPRLVAVLTSAIEAIEDDDDLFEGLGDNTLIDFREATTGFAVIAAHLTAELAEATGRSLGEVLHDLDAWAAARYAGQAVTPPPEG